MAYYTHDRLGRALLGARRPSINDYFLSAYTAAIYSGCEIGCPYCDGWAYGTRPLNETVRIADDLPQRAADELRDLDRGDLVAFTALSDPYQAAEAAYRLTRQTLQAFVAANQPCLVLTKSHTILEDRVLFEQLNQTSLGVVMFTLLTIDPFLSTKLEDKASAPAMRLEAIGELKRAGVPVGVAIIPLVPYVNDTDLVINTTLRAVAEAGADFVVWDFLHIPNERHRRRVSDMLARIGRYPPSYYRDLYGGSPLPDAAYRADRDAALLRRCDELNLAVRPPHALYRGRLSPQNEAALLLKHAAYRDRVLGRANLARAASELADDIYSGVATQADLRASALYPSLRSILGA